MAAAAAFAIDPVEKKPLNHFYPGTSILSFGTAGCNLGCKFCQNWDISKSRELMQLKDRRPHEFCLHHSDAELKKLLGFKHRTFNSTDLLYFIAFLQFHYSRYDSLEDAFLMGPDQGISSTVENNLIHFHEYFFSLEHVPLRTKKHIATPYKGSTCKRLNMFLRWMVRSDTKGVDFGLWKKIRPAQLVCPIDLHVARVAKRFHILERKHNRLAGGDGIDCLPAYIGPTGSCEI